MLDRATSSFHDLPAALPKLAAEAKSRALEFEANRKLSADFTDKFKRAGAFKVLVPVEAGGVGGTLPEWLEMAMTLAEADASTGWVFSHANICSGLIYASADQRFVEEFFADPMACAAWSSLPRIQVVEEKDGIRITGSWGFESGCTASTFVGGMVNLAPDADGRPRAVAALAPIAEAMIEETWNPVGLAGTGSHEVRFQDVFVPWHRTFAWPAARPRAPYPAAAFVPGAWFVSMGSAATHLGLARRALDEVRAGLHGKTDRFTEQPLLGNHAVQRTLESSEGLWFACRAGMREALQAVWDSAMRGEPLTTDLRLSARVAAVTARV
jgi:alkylation response protein AidB-like acyl-CoA dehydrogenase